MIVQEIFNACVTSLQFNIISKMRMISFSIISKNEIMLDIMISEELNNDEKDIVSTIWSEFDSELPSKIEIKVVVNIIGDEIKSYQLIPQRYLVFARYEGV